MVVGNLSIKGVPVFSAEADSPLVVDADAVLSGSVALQRFQPVSRWDPQILQLHGILQKSQFPPRNPVEITGETFGSLALPNTLGEPISEALDHV